MTTLKTLLPAFGFPQEYDNIVFSAETACEFEIACNEGSLLLKLSPNALGEIRIEDLAQVLRDFTADGKVHEFTLSWEENIQKFNVITCRFDLNKNAFTYCKKRFLTLQQGKKTTYLGAKEFVTMYNAFGARNDFSIALLWTNLKTAEIIETTLSEEQTQGVVSTDTNYYQLDVSPAQFTPPAEGFALHSYTVAAGKRSLRFILCPVLDAKPLTLVFRNCFGQLESFHCFGTIEQEVKPTRSSASFAGKTRNYRVLSAPEFTAQTGILRPCDFALFEDLCTADYVLLGSEQGPEVCITDNDFKLSSDLYEPQEASITWRYASRARRIETESDVRTFDNSFDNSFQ